MSGFVSAEPLAFGLAIVACHFALAFFWQAAKMTAGANPAFGRNPEASPARSYQLRVGRLVSGGAGGIRALCCPGPVSVGSAKPAPYS